MARPPPTRYSDRSSATPCCFGDAGYGYRFDVAGELVRFALIGLVGGLVGLLYTKVFYGIAGLTRRLPDNTIVKPAVGGLLVGLLGLAVPEVLGSGYGWVQEAQSRDGLLAMSLWVVLMLPLLKILATSLSIGTAGRAESSDRVGDRRGSSAPPCGGCSSRSRRGCPSIRRRSSSSA